MKERERKRLFKRIMSWVLVVCMTVGIIQGLSIAGVFKKAVKVQAAESDYLYLEIDFEKTVGIDSDKVKAVYIGSGDQNWPEQSGFPNDNCKMEKVEDGLYKIDTASAGTNDYYKFKFVIDIVGNNNEDIFHYAPSKSGAGNLNITSTEAGSKYYKVENTLGGPNDWTGKWEPINEMYFYCMDASEDLSNGVDAIFFKSTDANVSKQIAGDSVDGNMTKFKVPVGKYDMVKFVCGTKDLVTTSITDGNYIPNTSNVYYYKSVFNISDIEKYRGSWSTKPSSGVISSGNTLYFDSEYFSVSSSDVLKINNSEVELDRSSNIYKYTLSSDLNKDSIITFTKNDGTNYNFFWNDAKCNCVTLDSNQVAHINKTYYSNADKTVYFDATLSRLTYSHADGTNGKIEYGIPKKGDSVKFYAMGDGLDDISGNMTLMPTKKEGNNTYSYVYKADIPNGYNKIIFSSDYITSATQLGKSGESTGILNIPTNYTNPCFYADTSDDYIYNENDNNQRGGIWNEVYSVRITEDRAKESDPNGKVVDIPLGEPENNVENLYISSTLYDYYTDYELNGKNRDDYTADTTNAGHRIYQPFRQFNQALSDFYLSVNAEDPLYWGNFQNYEGSHYSQISDDLNLYGSNNTKKLFYQNNSMWGKNGEQLSSNANAVQGLVSDTLGENNELMIKTASNDVVAPYFNRDYLEGNNSKNTVLGKVYDDVTFPFTKKPMGSKSKGDETGSQFGNVDYWYFDSKSTNLRLTENKNKVGDYFLASSDDTVKGKTTEAATEKGNFFPFNDGDQSARAEKLNYGFGTKLEFKFRLTNNGTVLTTSNEEVPIEFTFSGDDDIWIFVDGKLALDIGGDHGEVNGYLNFEGTDKTKSYYVSGVKGEGEKTGAFDIVGSNTDEHILTLFYMERGLWESNMYLSFNFPDTNTLEIEKEVNTLKVNDLFKEYFNSYKSKDYSFVIKNYATHYPPKNDSEVNTGFVIKQQDIKDYGSIDNKMLMVPIGATYNKYNAEKVNDLLSQGTINSDGRFSIQDGQKAVFLDQFRRGSYIYLEEESFANSNSDLFTTKWTMYENGSVVTTMSGSEPGKVSSWVKNSATIPSMEDVGSMTVDDGRTEKVVEGEIGSTQIKNTGYTNESQRPETAFVFRSYKNPDTVNEATTLKVLYKNIVNTGSIKIEKKGYDSTKDNLKGTYTFEVKFSNVGGEKLEGSATIESQTCTIDLSDNDTTNDIITITGIPVGTEYTIEEKSISDGTGLKSVALNGTDRTDITLPGTKIITGKVETDGEEKTFTFKNTIPQYKVEYYKEISYDDFTDTTITGKKEEVTVNGEKKYFLIEHSTEPINAAVDVVVEQKTHSDEISGGTVRSDEGDDNTYRAIAGYIYNEDTTKASTGNNSGKATVTVDEIAVVKLFYEKPSTNYAVNYYLEVDKATYDAQKAEGKSVKEVEGKFFVRSSESIVTPSNSGKAGDSIEYVKVTATDGTVSAGIQYKKLNEATANNVTDTLKSFASENYVYDGTVTAAAAGNATLDSKTSDILADGYTAHVDLYYVKQPAEYKVEYYVEISADEYNQINDTSKTSMVGDAATPTKYFKKQEFVFNSKAQNKEAYVGDTIEYATLTDGNGIVARTPFDSAVKANVSGTEQTFDYYQFSSDYTAKGESPNATVNKDNTAVVKLYYVYKPSKYTEKYYRQVDEKDPAKDPKVYIVTEDGNIYEEYTPDTKTYTQNGDGEDIQVGDNVQVNDRQNEDPFKDYVLTDKSSEGYKPTNTVDKEGTTTVYQIYDKKKSSNPVVTTYTVRYFVQVDKAIYDSTPAADRAPASVDGKYFIKAADNVVNKANVDDFVEFDKTSDKKAGVTCGGTKVTGTGVTDTYKEFENYNFNVTTTQNAGKSQGKVEDGGKTVIDLYYEKIPAKYTVEYYLEVTKAQYNAATGVDKDIKNDYVNGKYFIKQTVVFDSSTDELKEYVGDRITAAQRESATDSSVIEAGVTCTGFEKGSTAVVVDKAYKSFEGYEYNSATTLLSHSTDTVNEGNTAVVRLYYEKIPVTYTVVYYKEVTKDVYDNTPDDSKKQATNGKYFIKAYEDVSNPTNKNDVVKYDQNDRKAGVTVNDSKAVDDPDNNIKDTYKKVPGYEFNKDTTEAQGRYQLTVDPDADNIIELYYELPDTPVATANYTVKYYVQVDKEVYDKTPVADRVPVPVDGKYFIKASEDVVNEAEVGDEVKYNKSDAKTAGVTCDDTKVTDKNTYKSFDKYEFNEQTTKDAGKSEGKVATGDTTVIELYYEKIPAKYTVEYYLRVDKDTYDKSTAPKDPDKDIIGGKYFIKQSYVYVSDTAENPIPVYVGDIITATSRKSVKDDSIIEAGITLTGFEDGRTPINVDEAFKSFDKYEYNPTTTNLAKQYTDTVEADGTAVVRLYYEKELTSYTEEYYVEVPDDSDKDSDYIKITTPDGEKIYKKIITNIVKDVEPDKEVEITDKQNDDEFELYKLIDPITYPDTYPSKTVVKDDGSTIVYQIYERRPIYVVEYYVEIEEEEYNKLADDKRDKVGDKFFEKKEIVIKGAEINDDVIYEALGRDAGVRISDNGVTKPVNDTYKHFENYEFKVDTTEAADSYKGVVDLDKDTIIKLYYENVITSYHQKYYIELDPEEAKDVTIDGENYIELTINGERKVFKLQDEDTIDKQKAGYEKTVVSKEGEGVYADYELITVDINGYPVTDTIKEDGSTVLYQIYVRKQTPEEPTPEPATTPQEPTTPAPTEPVPEPTTSQPTTQPTTTSTPVKTGDTVDMVLFALLFLSASVAGAVIISRRKEEN